MVKLKVQLIPKCWKCGKQMQQTIAHWQGYNILFIFCPNPQCRTAKLIDMTTGEEVQ